MTTIDNAIKRIARTELSFQSFINHPFITITISALIGAAIGTAFGLAT